MEMPDIACKTCGREILCGDITQLCSSRPCGLLSDLDNDSIQMYGKPLRGKYKHYCLEFDYLPIDENNTEFAYCQCYESSKEIEELREKRRLDIEKILNTGDGSN